MEGTEKWCLEALNSVPEGKLLTLMDINDAYSSDGSKKKKQGYEPYECKAG